MNVPTLSVRNLDDAAKQALRERAARHGVSMEQEARRSLQAAVEKPKRKKSILEELKRLGMKPQEPFDQKKVSDEMWNASFD
jgi:plasmid stability protein